MSMGGGGRHGESYVKSGSALPYEKKALKLYMYSCTVLLYVLLPIIGKNCPQCGQNKLSIL
jgi:hypothetical protein